MTSSGTLHFASTAPNIASTCERSVASQAIGYALVSFTSEASLEVSRAASATRMPSFANKRASDAERPLPAPTMSAVSGCFMRDALLRHAQQPAPDERPERLVGLADAFGERHASLVAQLGAKRLVGEVHGKRERLPRRGDRRRGRELPEDAQALLDRRIDAVHVEDRGALALARDRVDERARDLAGVGPRYAAGKRHLVGLACGGGENRESRFRGEALVAAHAVDDPGPDADARDVPVLGIHLGDLFVAVLVRAVERVHGAVAVVHRAVGRDRARVGDARDPETPRGFEHVDRADDVHFGPGDGIGLAERDLQGREMDHRAGAQRLEDPDDDLAIGDIAGAPRDLFQVALG